MKKSLIVFFKYILFWVVFFVATKALFLIGNHEKTTQLTIVEIVKIFLHGFKMDLSTACYFVILPALFLSFSPILPSKFLKLLFKVYTLSFLVILSLLAIIDLGLYPEWGSRLGVSAFNYIDDPKTMMASISFELALTSFLTFSVLIFGFNALYNKLFASANFDVPKREWYSMFIMIFMVSLLIIPIRGGLNSSPLNQSSVCFSNNQYANQAALNYFWNLGNSLSQSSKSKLPFKYMDDETCENVINDYLKLDTISSPKFIHLKDNQHPNVVLLILESFSNKLISNLGGVPDVCPNLNKLSTEGVTFTNYYSTGNRSDKGLSSILGVYPGLMTSSIMKFPEKSAKLRFITEKFIERDYHKSFYYGGDINFYKLKLVLSQANFDKVVGGNDFPDSLYKKSSWGVPDQYLFPTVLEDLKKTSTSVKPNFTVLYTLSSHPPYDVPFSKIKGTSRENLFCNSAAYTDSCIGVFVNELKKLPSWGNTLLIITSDHGFVEPKNSDVTWPETFNIPLMWLGGVVDTSYFEKQICMQTDLTPTLYGQLGWKYEPFKFGKDAFGANKYAIYFIDTGWGFVTDSSRFYCNLKLNFVHSFTNDSIRSTDLLFGKAYAQSIYQDFIKK